MGRTRRSGLGVQEAPARPWPPLVCVSIVVAGGSPAGSERSALPRQRVAASGRARHGHSFPGGTAHSLSARAALPAGPSSFQKEHADSVPGAFPLSLGPPPSLVVPPQKKRYRISSPKPTPDPESGLPAWGTSSWCSPLPPPAPSPSLWSPWGGSSRRARQTPPSPPPVRRPPPLALKFPFLPRPLQRVPLSPEDLAAGP